MPTDSPIRFAKCERSLDFLAAIDAQDLQALLLLRLDAWHTEPTSQQVADLLGVSLRTAKTRCLSLFRRGLLTCTIGHRGTTYWRAEQPDDQWLRVPQRWVRELTPTDLRILVTAVAASFWSAGWERRHRLEIHNAADLARTLGCHRSTVLRALETAEGLGAIEATSDTPGAYQASTEAQVTTWGRVARAARVTEPVVASVAQVGGPTCAGEVPRPEYKLSDAAPSPGAGERAGAAYPDEPASPANPPLVPHRCSRDCGRPGDLGFWWRSPGNCSCGAALVPVGLPASVVPSLLRA